jgi:hypothetical protein
LIGLLCILNDLARVHLMNELPMVLMMIRLDKIVTMRLIVDLRPCNQANLETHRSHDLYMSQNTISSEVNKGICEAFGCFAEAKWHLTENSSYEQISTAKRD